MRWLPTPSDVKAIIPQRLNGAPFGATTIPTGDEVVLLIGQVATDVVGDLGSFDSSATVDTDEQVTVGDVARGVVALGAAAYVEQSFFPEQSTDVVTSATVLFRRYEAAVDRLRRLVASIGGGDVEVATISTPSAVVADYVAVNGELLL